MRWIGEVKVYDPNNDELKLTTTITAVSKKQWWFFVGKLKEKHPLLDVRAKSPHKDEEGQQRLF